MPSLYRFLYFLEIHTLRVQAQDAFFLNLAKLGVTVPEPMLMRNDNKADVDFHFYAMGDKFGLALGYRSVAVLLVRAVFITQCQFGCIDSLHVYTYSPSNHSALEQASLTEVPFMRDDNSLKFMDKMRTLNVSENRLTGKALSVILSECATLPITKLDISRNTMDGEAVPAMEYFLQTNVTIQDLNLSNVKLGKDVSHHP